MTESTSTRIAVPSDAPGGLTAERSGHFGRCACFTVVDVVDDRVTAVEVLENPPHVEGGCLAPVARLAEHNVDALIVDGIGGRPLLGFHQVGIAVHAGVGQHVSEAVAAYVQGLLPAFAFESACKH
jgi:predicted Fe-Mo cluster-binding NifX family protein